MLLLLYLRAFLQISVLLMNFSIAAKDDYDLLFYLPGFLLFFPTLPYILKFFMGLYSWWSQSGSNRRPSACKADALPAELWPLIL